MDAIIQIVYKNCNKTYLMSISVLRFITCAFKFKYSIHDSLDTLFI